MPLWDARQGVKVCCERKPGEVRCGLFSKDVIWSSKPEDSAGRWIEGLFFIFRSCNAAVATAGSMAREAATWSPNYAPAPDSIAELVLSVGLRAATDEFT